MKLKFSFANKLMLSYLVMVLIPVVLIGSYSYTNSVHSIRTNSKISVARTLQQIRENIMGNVAEVSKISEQLYQDVTLSRLLTEKYQGYNVYEAMMDYIMPRLESSANWSSHKMRLSVYVKNDSLRERYNVLEGNPLANGTLIDLYSINRLSSEPWYADYKQKYGEADRIVGSTVWAQLGDDAAYGNISYVQHLVGYDKYTAIGFVRITVKLGDLFDAVDTFTVGDAGQAAVIDKQGNVLYGTKGTEAGWSPVPSSKQQVTEEALPDTDWKLFASVPNDVLEKGARKVARLTIVICAGSFAVLGLFGAVVSRYFSRRIYKIIASLRAFQGGDFRKRIQFGGSDEFGQMAHAFNEMAGTIEELINKVYVTELQKKDAELEALHTQIKPHFLYNTLSSINSLANLGEVDRLSRMVSGLSKFYRLTLNNGNTFISIVQEVQQVAAYIDIQTIKYRNRLEVTYDVDPAVLSLSTVKIVLQPFVENVLKHAWYDETIHICIRGSLHDDTVVLSVVDNGVGMRPETTESILKPGKQIAGCGIRNVDERIKLHFGQQYGVTISSRLGIGTSVRITFPVLHYQDRRF
ncbi:two-component system sensor histidine kinase YesM [Paenibacillus rhizosphaerae]|uniref:Two-component system sensor histidine kinase YesM n=1 Tax=Paenibacillus rhizosphaerae TaxID=297318 RepID=A0A839TQM1_9BACL|nr:sensor histidine kinase [Paenibacillus rhizosphaerae]MBB3127047.1 two-component system sensor histidine kinase YesM [Paenibacillus rhizosphaerae]